MAVFLGKRALGGIHPKVRRPYELGEGLRVAFDWWATGLILSRVQDMEMILYSLL